MHIFAESTLTEFATDSVEGQSYNYWSEFMHMLTTLGFILVLIFVSIWVLKRIMRSRTHHLNRSTGIKILERRVLNQKASLYLVDILGKGVVISESQAGVQLITEFSDETNIELLLDQAQEEPSSRLNFKETLSRKLKGKFKGWSSLDEAQKTEDDLQCSEERSKSPENLPLEGFTSENA